jgi:NADH-quinone oxidoreductase subunit M
MQKAFFGEVTAADPPRTGPPADPESPPRQLERISVHERLGAALLIGISLVVGLYPHLLLRIIVPSFDSPLFDWLRMGGPR